MPERQTIERARRDKAEGKAPTTHAGEFVREEMHHIRGGKHGARSTKQAIAIGLSKARRSGVKLPPPRNWNSFGKNPPERGTSLPQRPSWETPFAETLPLEAKRLEARGARSGVFQ